MEKHHILIAEDENDIMEFLIDLLEEDFRITSVPDVPAGLQKIEEQEFDIVITDLRMPGGSGLDILAKAKQKSKDTEVIIITGYGTLETVTEAMKLGISSYLLKPFSTQACTLDFDNSIPLISLLIFSVIYFISSPFPHPTSKTLEF